MSVMWSDCCTSGGRPLLHSELPELWHADDEAVTAEGELALSVKVEGLRCRTDSESMLVTV
jgi:hypothetical protein